MVDKYQCQGESWWPYTRSIKCKTKTFFILFFVTGSEQDSSVTQVVSPYDVSSDDLPLGDNHLSQRYLQKELKIYYIILLHCIN